MNFSAKSCRNCLISWKSTKTHGYAKTIQLFLRNYHVLVFRWPFQQKVSKGGSIRENPRKITDLAKTLQLFEQTTMFGWLDELFIKRLQKSGLIRQKAGKIIDFTETLHLFEQTTMTLHFDELYGKKLQKLPHFVKKHENLAIWPKLCNFFEQTTTFWCFDELLSKRLQKIAQFVKKHEKSSIWRKLCNFSNKLPCLCISINFSGKSCRKCLISRESTKNHRFGDMFATFRTNYHVFAFRWTFQEKVAKSASFREKARKIIDLAKTLQLFEETTMFWYFDELFSKKLQKVPYFVKKHEKSSILAKTRNFSNKLPCFDPLVNFSAKCCRKCLVFWENSKNHRLGQNLQLFRTKYHVYAFRWTFRKRLQKVPRFVKKHEKSSIWQKLATFRTNYHVLAFSWPFQQKVSKSASIGEKAREIIDLAKTIQLFQQTTMILHFDELLRKRWEKVVHFVKKHEISQIWSNVTTFRENYHVLTFRCTFQQKVAKTASFRDKARKLIDLAKTMQLFRTNYHVYAFRWLLQEKVAKRWKKWLISWKMTKNHRFGLNLQLFEQTTMFRRFCQLFSKKWVISWKSTKNRHSEVA